MESLWLQKSRIDAVYIGAVFWVIGQSCHCFLYGLETRAHLSSFIPSLKQRQWELCTGPPHLSSPAVHLILRVAAQLRVPWRWRVALCKAGLRPGTHMQESPPWCMQRDSSFSLLVCRSACIPQAGFHIHSKLHEGLRRQGLTEKGPTSEQYGQALECYLSSWDLEAATFHPGHHFFYFVLALFSRQGLTLCK